MKIGPQPGPQTAFCSSTADVVIYGGAAGGGKSWALVYEPLRNVHVEGYSAVIFRRTSPQLTGGGSVWDESLKLYPLRGGVPREHRLDWRFPSGGGIEFRHLQHEKDKHSHQSKQYAVICFDELVQFTRTQFWYLFSRNRSVCGVQPYIRAATNPDPDSWVLRELIWWWIDTERARIEDPKLGPPEGWSGFPIKERAGKVRWFTRINDELHWSDSPQKLRGQFGPEVQVTSVTFIPALLQDNPALMKADPAYLSKLMAMPLVDREQLLGGNWKIRPAAGTMFMRHWFEVVDQAPAVVMDRVRAWDEAGTKPNKDNPDPDWTIGARMSRTAAGIIFIEHVVRMRDTDLAVEQAITGCAAQDGRETTVCVWQDPGSAGVARVKHLSRKLSGFKHHFERAALDKTSYAKPVSSDAEAGNIKLVRGPWNDAYLTNMEAFPDGRYKDDTDATSLGHLKLTDSNLEALKKLARW